MRSSRTDLRIYFNTHQRASVHGTLRKLSLFILLSLYLCDTLAFVQLCEIALVEAGHGRVVCREETVKGWVLPWKDAVEPLVAAMGLVMFVVRSQGK